MEYKPKVITGKVTGTGWPIDGHVLWFSQWDYDNRRILVPLRRWPLAVLLFCSPFIRPPLHTPRRLLE